MQRSDLSGAGTFRRTLIVMSAVFALLATAVVLAPTAAAQEGLPETEAVVALDAVWSYLDDGSDQGNAWVDPGFDDTAWASGPGELGYGDGDEATVVGFGGDANNRYATTYFRHSFEVAEPYQLLDVRARIKRDDAAIVYFNGAEVWRSTNLPANVTFATFATSNAAEGVFDDITIGLDSLLEGTNTIAVEIHNRGAANSDISMAFEIEADRDASIPPGPRMAPDEFEVAAGEVLADTVVINDIAGLTYSVNPGVLPDPGTQGTLAVAGDGSFTWTPVAGFAGTIVVPVTGCSQADPEFCGDRDLAIDVLGVSAGDDSAETAFATAVSGNVGENDSDNGNGALTWALLSGPDESEGQLDFAPTGAWTFTPAGDFSGGVDIDYEACDAQGDCDGATLTILVATDKLELEFSQQRGYITGPVTIELTTTDPDATIRYSTSWGTEWLYDDFIGVSQVYSGPINISGSTQLRAVAFTDDQQTDVESHTFIDISSYSAQDQAIMAQYPVFETSSNSLGSRSNDATTIVEFFWPDGRYDGGSAPAGIRNRQGGTGQNGDFRLYFRSEYGDGRLNYELFPDEPAGAQASGGYDKVNFHGGSQDAFGFSWSYNGCNPGAGTMMRDRFFQRLQLDTNGDGVRGQYYLMFKRGELVGIKNAEDVPQQGFMEESFGGEKDEYGLWTWYSRELLGNTYGGSFASNRMDVTNWIDYLLVQWFSGNTDWGGTNRNNNVVVGGMEDGPYYHWTWDSHATDPGCSRNWGATPLNLTVPTNDSDYRMAFADRVLLHFGSGGALSQTGVTATWDDLANELQPAVSLVYNENSWRSAEQSMRGRVTTTPAKLLNWLQAQGYASTVTPVSYSIAGGAVAAGSSVTLSGGNEIYFTIDGTDPRASGGGVSGSAIAYNGAVALPDGTVQMLARVRSGNNWSAAQPVIFQVGDGPGLVINEIHFNPADGFDGGVEVDGDEYEFVELANLGSTAVNLEYFRFQGGIRSKFDYGRSPIIQPGEYVVLAENAERFAQRYGFQADGIYLDKLSNSTDEVRLVDTQLNTVDVVTYEDSWAARADGEGPSLSFRQAGDNAEAASWGWSGVDGGTPGQANVLAQPEAAAEPGLILNEWNAVSSSNLLADGDVRLGSVRGNGGDWFELVVVNDHVDARGWRFVVSETDGSEVLILSQDAVWSDLRSGTIITIAEQDVVAEDGTIYAQDASYDPQGGDWWIHAVAGEAGNGSLVTAVNFPVTANDWQAAIYNAAGDIQWGPVGEGIGALEAGVGNDEIGELEADPSPDIDPVTAPYDDGDESTFALPNNFGEGAQNFGLLRSVVNAPPVVDPIADQTGGVGNSATLTPNAVDNEGDPFTWSADGLPPGITIDPDSGVMSGEFTESGVFNVTVSATDVFSPGTASFVWDVAANGLPAIAVVADQASITGDTISLAMSAVDPEGDAFTWSATGLPDGLSIDESTGLISGVVTTMDNYSVEIQATDPFGVGTLALAWTVTDPEVDVTLSCVNEAGTVTVDLFNSSGSFATYRVTIGSRPAQQRSISGGLRTTLEATGLGDGETAVVVERNNNEVYNSPVTIGCGPEVTPTPTPTPTPVPEPTPTPTPGPTPTPTPGDGIVGADQPVEVMHTVTCLAGNGRVDTNIVNTGAGTANYRVEFEGLSARARDVGEGDWWRQPITGRPDRDFQIIVKRDTVVVSDTTVTVACDDAPAVTDREVQVVNACRAGNGYVLFQFANPTDAPKAWVIEFEGVPNRSTSAQAHGGSVRAVTGRQDGTYDVLVRTGSTPVAEFQVTVACDA